MATTRQASLRRSRDSQQSMRAAGARERTILAATIQGSSIAFIDGTVVTVALSALQSALHAPLSVVQWVVESYALFLAALLLIAAF